LAEKMLDQFKNRLSEVALIPSSGGVFEVTLGGEKIYSKLQTGVFPNERALLAELDSKLT